MKEVNRGTSAHVWSRLQGERRPRPRRRQVAEEVDGAGADGHLDRRRQTAASRRHGALNWVVYYYELVGSGLLGRTCAWVAQYQPF